MPTAHLVSGLPCSGKTTYSIALRSETNGILFSLDRWLITAFGQYAIADVGHEEHVRRVLASRQLIWTAAAELLRGGTDVILDDGFFLREHRMRCVELARRVRASATIHFVDTPLPVIHDRLVARNAALPDYNFRIDPELLVDFVGLYETPSADEGAEVIVVSGATQRAT